MTPQYWIVGATVQEMDMAGYFIEGGYWFADAAGSLRWIEEIRSGDRLIMKKGYAVPRLEIKAMGTVKDIKSFSNDILTLRLIIVSWMDLRHLSISISARGMFSAVHGPLAKSNEAVSEIFAAL